jgi:hypothetical protein
MPMRPRFRSSYARGNPPPAHDPPCGWVHDGGGYARHLKSGAILSVRPVANQWLWSLLSGDGRRGRYGRHLKSGVILSHVRGCWVVDLLLGKE